WEQSVRLRLRHTARAAQNRKHRNQTIANGTISGQSRRRTGPSAAAGGAWVFGSGGPRPVYAAGIPGVLGQAADDPEPGWRPVRAARQAAAVDVSDLQPAVSDAD